MEAGTINYNLFTENRWHLIVPTRKIDDNATVSNVGYNITSADVPAITMAYSQFHGYGYTYDVPSGARDVDKKCEFFFNVESSFYQYKLLHKWFSKLAIEDGSGSDDISGTEITTEAMDTVRLVLLSEYRTPVIEFIFEDAWVSEIGKLTFDYRGDAKKVECSFSIRYSTMKILEEIKHS